MKKIIIIFLFLIMITLISCNQQEGRFQIIVNNNCNLRDFTYEKKRTGSCIYILNKDTGEWRGYYRIGTFINRLKR